MKTLLISAGAVALLFVSAAGATAQAPVTARSKAPETWVQPRTPWGDPDLQEIWSTEDLRDIPYERPDEFVTGTPLGYALRFLDDPQHDAENRTLAFLRARGAVE